MNEVTKLYENAGIKPTKNWQSCLNCKLKTEIRYDEWGCEYLTCNRLEMPKKCPDAKEYYPLFTAEKQLELIKWLANYDEVCRMEKIRDGWFVEIDMITSELSSTFKEALANLINKIWQDLTDAERTQIRGILE